MLERINLSNTTTNTPSKQVKKQHVAVPVSSQVQVSKSFEGLDALASYNSYVLRKNVNFDIPVVEKIDIPDNFDSLEGEHIYDSAGRLVCVVCEDNNKRYVYHNNEEKFVEVFDKTSNEKLKEQTSYVNLNDEEMISVVEFVPGRKDSYQTFYKVADGQIFLDSKSKNVNYEDGSYNEYIYYPVQKEYQVIEHSNFKNTNWLFDKSITYDENKNVKKITEHGSNSWREKEVKYKNGCSYALEETNITAIPNNLGKDPMTDPDLKPSQKFEVTSDPKSIDGFKTYYSNGVIEKNITKESVYYFNYNGDLSRIQTNNKNIIFNMYGQTIEEKLENGAIKTTMYSYNKDKGNGQTYVKYEKDNFCKELSILNNKPVNYFESRDGKDWTAIYNQDGDLLRVLDN